MIEIQNKQYLAISLISIIITTYSVIIAIYLASPSWERKIKGSTYSLAISSSENCIVSASNSELVYLFHPSNPTPIRIFNTSDDIDHVDISHDGKYIVAGGDYRLFLYDVISNSILWTYDAQNYIIELMISGNGNYIVMVDLDNMIYVFHKSSSVPLWNKTHSYIHPIDISFDGSLILVGGSKISLFNSSLSTPLWVYNAPMDSYDIKISDDSKYICAATHTYTESTTTIQIFQTNSSLPIWNYNISGDLSSIDFSADGNYIVAGDVSHNIWLFNRNSKAPIFSYKMSHRPTEISISDNGDYFAVGAYVGQILFFKRGNSNPLWSYSTRDYLFTMELSSSGKFLVGSFYGSYFFLLNKNTPYIYADNSMAILLFWATIGLIILSIVLHYAYNRRFH